MVKSEGILYALTPAGAATGSSFAEKAMLGWSKAIGRTIRCITHSQEHPSYCETMVDIFS